MQSVAERVLRALGQRLLAIRGGDFACDLQDRVYFTRPSYDLPTEMVPAAFIARRPGGGATRQQKPGINVLSDTTVIFDVVGVVARGLDDALAVEQLLADFHRALEVPGDAYLRCPVLQRNLLSAEIFLADVDLSPYTDGFPFEVTGVGVQCTWPHKYGDPDHVA